jgi:hypothetical protein
VENVRPESVDTVLDPFEFAIDQDQIIVLEAERMLDSFITLKELGPSYEIQRALTHIIRCAMRNSESIREMRNQNC